MLPVIRCSAFRHDGLCDSGDDFPQDCFWYLQLGGNVFAVMKIVAAVLLVLLIGVVLELIGGRCTFMEKYSVALLYKG